MSLLWPVLIFFLFADAPRDDWFPYWVMMGSPITSMTLLTRASIAPYALDPWPGVAFAALCWTAMYAAAAAGALRPDPAHLRPLHGPHSRRNLRNDSAY